MLSTTSATVLAKVLETHVLMPLDFADHIHYSHATKRYRTDKDHGREDEDDERCAADGCD